jgi:hypothetical protein
MPATRHFYKISGHGEIDFRTFVEISRDADAHKWNHFRTVRMDARKFIGSADPAIEFDEKFAPVLVTNMQMPHIVKGHLENRFNVQLEYVGNENEDN